MPQVSTASATIATTSPLRDTSVSRKRASRPSASAAACSVGLVPLRHQHPRPFGHERPGDGPADAVSRRRSPPRPVRPTVPSSSTPWTVRRGAASRGQGSSGISSASSQSGEEGVELLAADLLGQGDEVVGGHVGVPEVGRPALEDRRRSPRRRPCSEGRGGSGRPAGRRPRRTSGRRPDPGSGPRPSPAWPSRRDSGVSVDVVARSSRPRTRASRRRWRSPRSARCPPTAPGSCESPNHWWASSWAWNSSMDGDVDAEGRPGLGLEGQAGDSRARRWPRTRRTGTARRPPRRLRSSRRRRRSLRSRRSASSSG